MERRPGLVCPRIMKLFEDRFLLSERMICTWNGADSFEVEAFGHTFIVDLSTRECTCRIWKLTGIPCDHSIPCITTKRLEPIDFVDPCYHKSLLLQTYENVLFPTTSASFWVKVSEMTLAPPHCVTQPGRPKKLRKRGILEPIKRKGKLKASKKGKQRCGVCGQDKHNKKTCPNKSKFPESSNKAAKVLLAIPKLYNLSSHHISNLSSLLHSGEKKDKSYC